MRFRSIFHQFCLVAFKEPLEISAYIDAALKGEKNGVDVLGIIDFPDDLLHYMYETFFWLPVLSPVGARTGIDIAGCCLIKQNAKAQLSSLLDGWLTVFSQAPEEFTLLVGNQSITFEKAYVVDLLSKLIAFAARIDDEQNTCILYTGL